MMVNFLKNQVESYERAAWKIAHDEAMACREVEELIDVGICYFEAARHGVLRWKSRIAAGQETFRVEDAAGCYKLYAMLNRGFDSIAKRIRELENLGYVVDQSDDFRAKHIELKSITSIPFDRIVRSVEQLNSGKARPLGEVMDELRARHHA